MDKTNADRTIQRIHKIKRSSIVYILFIAFSLPYLILLIMGGIPYVSSWQNVFSTYFNNTIQAFLSAQFSLLIGLLLAPGLVFQPQKNWLQNKLQVIALLPSTLPAIFTLLSLMTIFKKLPHGLPGIVIVHVAINCGLIASALARIFQERAGGYIELAWIEGTSRTRLLIAFAKLFQRELFSLFLFVFSVCFVSFSIPLILSSGSPVSIEVLIFEKMRIQNQISEATAIALLQSLVLIFGAYYFKQRKFLQPKASIYNLSYLSNSIAATLIVCISLAVTLGLVLDVPLGIQQIINTGITNYEEIFQLLLGSITLSILVGAMTLLATFLTAKIFRHRFIDFYFSIFSLPSATIVSFGLLLLQDWQQLNIIKIAWAITILHFGSLFRYQWSNKLNEIEPQIVIAHTLGASNKSIFDDILWPQVRKTAYSLAALSAFWATGDFAISKVLSTQNLHLASFVQSLMGSYRIEMASTYALLLFIIGSFCYAAIIGAARVFNKKYS